MRIGGVVAAAAARCRRSCMSTGRALLSMPGMMRYEASLRSAGDKESTHLQCHSVDLLAAAALADRFAEGSVLLLERALPCCLDDAFLRLQATSSGPISWPTTKHVKLVWVLEGFRTRQGSGLRKAWESADVWKYSGSSGRTESGIIIDPSFVVARLVRRSLQSPKAEVIRILSRSIAGPGHCRFCRCFEGVPFLKTCAVYRCIDAARCRKLRRAFG